MIKRNGSLAKTPRRLQDAKTKEVEKLSSAGHPDVGRIMVGQNGEKATR
jgi:hypothetical protein